MDELWSKFVVRLGQQNPFFSCLALFANLVETEATAIAETTGQEVRVNPQFILGLKENQAFAYLLHQILHLALQHTRRGLGRDVQIWNIAADIVVNNIIVESTNWKAAPFTASNLRFKDKSVEEVYCQLLSEHFPPGPIPSPLGEPRSSDSLGADGSSFNDDASESDTDDPTGDEPGDGTSGNVTATADDGNGSDETSCSDDQTGEPSSVDQARNQLAKYEAHHDLVTSESLKADITEPDSIVSNQQYWEDASVRATYATNDRTQGQLPAGLYREFMQIERSKFDWRKALWRYVSDRRSDFTEFDQRHIHRGLYLEELRVEGITIAIAIDTSGSISALGLGTFIREIEEIQRLYSDVEIHLYYCDATVDGPYSVTNRTESYFSPTGGGGTSFAPFFAEIEKLKLTERPDCLIYFTDGFGDFPSTPPRIPVFWLLIEGSRDHDEIPFGFTVSLPTSNPLSETHTNA